MNFFPRDQLDDYIATKMTPILQVVKASTALSGPRAGQDTVVESLDLLRKVSSWFHILSLKKTTFK